jgi:thiol peroxidase
MNAHRHFHVAQPHGERSIWQSPFPRYNKDSTQIRNKTYEEEFHMERPGATTLKGNPLTLIGPELKPGDSAPDFSLVDNTLKPVTLADTGRNVRIISVVPSLDTPVCDAQTKRFNEETAKLPGVDIITVSMDLPFAQKRWCGAFGVDKVKMLSDHKEGSFGSNYGTLIKELRIESRAIFVLDQQNKIRHAEYVKEVADHPNYETALSAARNALSVTA